MFKVTIFCFMMKNFKKVLREINFSLDYILLFDSIISSVMIFLLSFLILSAFNISKLFGILPAVIYFIVESYIRFSKDKARIVEEKYPELNELLRTAEDNIALENPIINELQSEIVSKLRNVRLSAFLNTKRFSYKIFLCIILSFITISFSIFGINVSLISPLIDNIQLFGGNKSLGSLNNLTTTLNISDEIYGDSAVAKLGNSLIDIKIKPAVFEVSVKEQGKPENKEFYESFPSDIYVEKTNTYEENVPKEQQELVKNYFKKIAE